MAENYERILDAIKNSYNLNDKTRGYHRYVHMNYELPSYHGDDNIDQLDAIKYFFITKGDKNMSEPASKAELMYRKKMEELEDKHQKHTKEDEMEYSEALFKLQKEYEQDMIKEEVEKRAFKRYTYYQSLIDQGFSEEAAMKILLQEI